MGDRTPIRVVVTGSRSWRDWRTIRNAIADIPDGSLVVHGAATGADHMARSAALAFGLDTAAFFPDYARHSVYEAPLRRNELMFETLPDLCLAFPTKSSRGTWHAVSLAESAGVEVINYGWQR